MLQKQKITKATLMDRKTQYAGMKSDDAKRLEELQSENRRLKELLTASALDKRLLKEAMERNY